MEATAVVPEGITSYIILQKDSHKRHIGRITPHDAGIWAEKHIAPLKRIVNFAHIEDTPIGIQLAHAGRKASTRVPWTHNNVIGESVVPDGIAHEDEEGWPDNGRIKIRDFGPTDIDELNPTVWSASDIPFSEDYPKPKALTLEGIEKVKTAFKDAVKRCIEIGCEWLSFDDVFKGIPNHGAHKLVDFIEVSSRLRHMILSRAHQRLRRRYTGPMDISFTSKCLSGLLLLSTNALDRFSFVSPLSNNRKDKYGGSFENRIRLSLEIAQIVREEWPVEKPLFYRVSATDWAEGPEKDDSGKWKQWGIEQTIKLATELQKVGVDLVDCSTGGNWVKQKIPICPGYQVRHTFLASFSRRYTWLNS
jgi:2,4-dienoyl-CoA reductase-like NADH-dependent reductase (Old Yellow Enzyme family)